MTRTAPWPRRITTLRLLGGLCCGSLPDLRLRGSADRRQRQIGARTRRRLPNPRNWCRTSPSRAPEGSRATWTASRSAKTALSLQKRRIGEPTRRTLSKEEIATLAGLLGRPGLFAKDRTVKSEAAADQMYFTIRYRGVTVSTGGGNVPPDLDPVVGWCLKQLQ